MFTWFWKKLGYHRHTAVLSSGVRKVKIKAWARNDSGYTLKFLDNCIDAAIKQGWVVTDRETTYKESPARTAQKKAADIAYNDLISELDVKSRQTGL